MWMAKSTHDWNIENNYVFAIGDLFKDNAELYVNQKKHDGYMYSVYKYFKSFVI
jgi:hypothetical protein